MAEGYVGQIFNSIQGEGLYVGRRQIFVRFAGCSLSCLYCDTMEFRKFRPRECEVQTRPGSAEFRRLRNPMSHEEVLGHVRRLRTPDVHSVSLTGGEPLLAGDFLIDISRSCRESGLSTYLETSGADSGTMGRVAEHINIAAIDIKLPEHQAVPRQRWRHLLREELSCFKAALRDGIKTFAKIVVLPSTKASVIAQVCSKLAEVGEIPVVLQPVTPAGKIRTAPSMTHMYHLAQAASKAGIKEIAIIPQVHKLIGVL
jgi:organic radical activating enzyme